MANGLVRVCGTVFWVPYQSLADTRRIKCMCLSSIWLPAYSLVSKWVHLPYTPEAMHLFGRSGFWYCDRQALLCVPA